MPVSKNQIEKSLAQLRKIEAHRQVGSEKEIRRTYKAILKDLKQFIGYEYAELAEDGKLTYEILQQKGEFARFLDEVESRIDTLSPAVSKEIKELVESTYQACYDGMTKAVVKSTTVAELHAELQGLRAVTPETIKRAVENPISGLTLKDTLEKNRREIIYDIKRNISLGLANGDRPETMAKRISKCLDGDYQKAIRIARTESHRVREAGFHDSATDINETLKQGVTDVRMVKTWRTMGDERVRPNVRYKTKKGWKTSRRGKANHEIMDGVTIAADEKFELSDGTKTMAPSQSGVAYHDINCRCRLSYDLMTDAEYFKQTGKHFKGFDKRLQAYTAGDINYKTTTLDDVTDKNELANVFDISGDDLNDFFSGNTTLDEILDAFSEGDPNTREFYERMIRSNKVKFKQPSAKTSGGNAGTPKNKAKAGTQDDLIEAGLNEKEARKIRQTIDDMDGQERDVWRKQIKGTKYSIEDEEGLCYFNPDDGKVHMPSNARSKMVFHETAHAHDNGISRLVESMHEDDWEDDIASLFNVMGIDLYSSEEEIASAFYEWGIGMKKKYPDSDFGSFSDIISGLTNDMTGGSMGLGGHSEGYWLETTGDGPLMRYVEGWADYCSLRAAKDKAMLELLDKTCPSMSKALKTAYKEVYGV